MKRTGLKFVLACCVLASLASKDSTAALHSGRHSYLATNSGFHLYLFDHLLPDLLVNSVRPALSVAAVYVVDSTLDTPDAAPGNNVCADSAGRCTLRAAIQEANAHAGADTINFSIASGLQTINAASDLSTITEPITIDATTQPGYSGLPLIEVAGVSSAFAFDVTAGNTIIKGLILNRWNTAIQFDVAGGNVVENCYIGTNSSGTVVQANQDGIVIRSNNNRIGGNTSGARNVISGNTRVGVSLNGGDNNLVQGNYVGTNASGTAIIAGLPGSPNGIGVEIIAGNFNTVGGTGSGEGNVVSGNRNANILVRRDVALGAPTDSNIIQGNLIGTTATGLSATINNTRGIYVDSATNTTIGGTSAGARNVISSHTEGLVASGAIWITGGSNATGTIIEGNFIGTNITGNSQLVNTASGILVVANETRIGGVVAGAGNLISGNGGSGLRVSGINNSIQGNLIGTNAGGSADLGNAANGISIEGGTNNTIGGPGPEARNLISGNNQNGVLVSNPSSLTTIQGNLIGTDITGNTAIGNSLIGVRIDNSASNTVGSASAQSAVNVISGNTFNGVTIAGTNATNNLVIGNRVGTNASGTAALQNGQVGVRLDGGASSNKVGDLTSAPGTAPGNLISGQIGPTNGIGVLVSGTGTRLNAIFGNLIGTDVTGTIAIPNGTGVQVRLGATQNLIGEKIVPARNIISGNTAIGVVISESGASDNQVLGNFIGTDITGNNPLGNSFAGVMIFGSPTNNVIGGAVAGSRNVISATRPDLPTATGGYGVYIWLNATGNFVQGNLIGTNATGNAALPNAADGVKIETASTNTIGGNQAGARNFISGNGGNGVLIGNNGNTNVIQNNVIGLAADGSTPLPNSGNGIQVVRSAVTSTAPAGNAIGGTGTNEPNTIANNNGKGISLVNALNTPLLSNSIFANAGLGIDLLLDGVSPNDDCDADSGPNDLQNYPVLDSATNFGGATTIAASFNSAPATSFTIQLFVNDSCDASDYGEGQTLLDTFTVSTDASCQNSFVKIYAPEIPPGKFITATATDASGNTSEFSKCRMVGAPTAANASISGRIFNDRGTPLSGVVLLLQGERGSRTITGEDGRFAFNDLAVGNFYTVTPARANYSFSPANQSFSLVADKTDAVFVATQTAEVHNPLDTPEYFVRQQYLDFLNREPDQGGFDYWSARLDTCHEYQLCLSRTRSIVSAAFFIEREFQDSGLFIYDLYQGALGRRPAFAEYLLDRKGLVGGPTLAADKAAFVASFVERADFRDHYPLTMTSEVFVDALIRAAEQSSRIDLGSERATLVNLYHSGSTVAQSRGLVLRSIVESESFKNAHYNSAFVLMQYFGYLRRDADVAGYQFWLDQLNGAPRQDYSRQQMMVCSFITSAEYQQRFSLVVTHNNTECP